MINPLSGKRGFDWNLIKSFLSILEAGSLSAASKSSQISQPTLSRHVDELEKELSVTLFERGRMGAVPTSAALAIADHARAVQSATQALSLSASGKSEELKGTVRITASQMVSAYILPDILVKLIDKHPEIEIELVSTNAVENLSEREADIAIRMVRPEQKNLIARKVTDIPLGTYVHKNYYDKHGAPVTAEELLNHRIIGYDKDNSILSALHTMGIAAERNNFRFRCDDQITNWQALCAAIGVGFAPNYLAKTNPDLIRIGEDFPVPTLPVWLAAHREVKTNRRIRVGFDFLASELAKVDLS